MRRSILCLAAAISIAALLAPLRVEAEEAKEQGGRALLGAESPRAGKIVVFGETGMIFVLPHFTAGAMIGVGGGALAELRYRNIAGAGQSGRFRVAWGTRIHEHLVYGVAARTSITSLGVADGGLIGIEFSNIAIGNDWEVGSDLYLTWIRPGNAHITASIGPNWTLGGVRYSSFNESEFRIEPGLRSVLAAVQGEWPIRPRLNVFLRLDAAFLIGTEIVPLGYIPTGSVGFGWSV
ncbi:MAG TPA: hypothetical protein VE093_43280 [Polyangiaceae bacterium]|nr:hypothetical protein [Polyangiaceae bacterium]